MLREIRWVDPTDNFADALVIQTYVYNVQLENYMNLPWYSKLLVAPPEAPLRFSGDSSTGLGQIFAKTAVNALNWYFEGLGCEVQYNYGDIHQAYEIWDKLRTDDVFNIDMVGLVLLYGAEAPGELDLNINTIAPIEIRKILARYNGFGSAAAQYGNEVYEYYECFLRYNNSRR
jgi:hypothetical protein